MSNAVSIGVRSLTNVLSGKLYNLKPHGCAVRQQIVSFAAAARAHLHQQQYSQQQ